MSSTVGSIFRGAIIPGITEFTKAYGVSLEIQKSDSKGESISLLKIAIGLKSN